MRERKLGLVTGRGQQHTCGQLGGWTSAEAHGMKKDPANVTRWKHRFGFHNRGVQWDTPMSMWAGEGKDLDTVFDTKPAPQGGRDDQRPENVDAADGERKTEGWRHPVKETKRCGALVLEKPTSGKKLMLEIRRGRQNGGGLCQW